MISIHAFQSLQLKLFGKSSLRLCKQPPATDIALQKCECSEIKSAQQYSALHSQWAVRSPLNQSYLGERLGPNRNCPDNSTSTIFPVFGFSHTMWPAKLSKLSVRET
jgi:hypothetical protein